MRPARYHSETLIALFPQNQLADDHVAGERVVNQIEAARDRVLAQTFFRPFDTEERKMRNADAEFSQLSVHVRIRQHGSS